MNRSLLLRCIRSGHPGTDGLAFAGWPGSFSGRFARADWVVCIFYRGDAVFIGPNPGAGCSYLYGAGSIFLRLSRCARSRGERCSQIVKSIYDVFVVEVATPKRFCSLQEYDFVRGKFIFGRNFLLP